MWAITPLVLSAIGMLLLVALKSFELRRQRVFFGNARASLDARVCRLSSMLRSDLPRKTKLVLADMAHRAAMHASGFALRAVRFIERRLARFVDMVKGRRELHRTNGTRSTYLRDVTHHRDEVRRQNGYHSKN